MPAGSLTRFSTSCASPDLLPDEMPLAEKNLHAVTEAGVAVSFLAKAGAAPPE